MASERDVANLIDACRVPESVAPCKRGLWEIRRGPIPPIMGGTSLLARYSSMTALCRWTMGTLHQDIGEVVMEDSPRELRRHLPILLAAQGRVLVSGLGLGCVVRGLLSKPDVWHVDVIEIDNNIVDLIGPEFVGNPRVTIHRGNSEMMIWPESTLWNYAWHDVWSEEENLAFVHLRLIHRYRRMARCQGAWMFPRLARRLIADFRPQIKLL